jgi:hypothetical protein
MIVWTPENPYPLHRFCHAIFFNIVMAKNGAVLLFACRIFHNSTRIRPIIIILFFTSTLSKSGRKQPLRTICPQRLFLSY